MKSKAAEMREAFPDRVAGTLLESRADGRGVVELSTGAQIIVDFPPAGAQAVAIGTRGHVNFTKGNVQRPFWRTCSCGDRSAGGGAAALALTENWVCHLADPARSSSWTAAGIDLSEPGDIGEQDPLTLFAQAIRVENLEPEDFPVERGKHSAIFEGIFGFQQFYDTDGLSGPQFSDLLDAAEVVYDAIDGEASTICRIRGHVYIQLFTYLDTGEGEAVSTMHILRFHSSDPFEDADVPIWLKSFPGLSPCEQTDVIVAEVPAPGDDPGMVERVFALGRTEGTMKGVYLDAETGDYAGDDEAPFDMDPDPYPDDAAQIGLDLHTYRSRTFYKEQKAWINTHGEIYAYTLAFNGVAELWNSVDEWELDQGGIRPTAVIMGLGLTNSLICATAKNNLYQTIFDYPYSKNKDSFGEELEPEERVTVAEGTSYRRGTMAVNATTGVRGTPFFGTGTPEFVDDFLSSRTETLVEIEPYTYTGPAPQLVKKQVETSPGEFEIIEELYPDDGSALSGARSIVPARFHKYFFKVGVEPDPATADWIREHHAIPFDEMYGPFLSGPNTPGADAAREAYEGAIEDNKERSATIYETLAASQPFPGARLAADFWEQKVSGLLKEKTDLDEPSNDPYVDAYPEGLTYRSVATAQTPAGGLESAPVVCFPYSSAIGVADPDDDTLSEIDGTDPLVPYDPLLPPDGWRSFEEYEDDQAAFDNYYSHGCAPGPDPMAPPDNPGSWRDPAATFTHVHIRKFIWINAQTLLLRYASGLRGNGWGASAATSNGLLVSGPVSAQYYDPDTDSNLYRPLVWTAHRRTNGSEAWHYEHPETGGTVFCDAGNPIALADGRTWTFVVIDTEFSVIVLSGTGQLLEQLVGIENVLAAIFNGTHLISNDGKRFGLPL